MLRLWLLVGIVACGGRKEVAPAPVPPPLAVVAADAGVPDAAEAVTATEPEPPPFDRDGCDYSGIELEATERALLWSCLGVATDVPKGLSVSGGPVDLDGIVYDVSSAGDDPAIVGQIRVGRIDVDVKDTLQLGKERSVHKFGDRFVAAGPEKRSKLRVQRAYVDKASGLRLLSAMVVLEDQLHAIRFDLLTTTLTAAQLEKAVAPLFVARPLTDAERKLVTVPDWRPTLVDRIVPIKGGELVLCSDGTYTTTAEIDNVAPRGTYQLSVGTLRIAHPEYMLAEGVYEDYDGLRVGNFGAVQGPGPYPPAGARCAKRKRL